MQKKEIERFLSDFNGSNAETPFGPEALVFKVMGKMFALVSQNEATARLTLKCPPEEGKKLIGQYESIVPGYYMNKKHWITLSLTGELSDDLLATLMKNSYALVVGKLTKAEKASLQENYP